MKDLRKSPRIFPSLIFLCIVLAVAFRKKSMLEIDQISRTKEFRRFFNVQRKMVVSDSTIFRSLCCFDFVPLRRYPKTIYLKVKQKGLCKVSVWGRELRLGCVDGSQFGTFYGSVFMLIGETDLFLDIEVTENKGKELPASRALIERVYHELSLLGTTAMLVYGFKDAPVGDVPTGILLISLSWVSVPRETSH